MQQQHIPQSHPLKALLTSMILYTSQYPYPKQFESLKNIFSNKQILLDNSKMIIKQVVEELISDLNREIVYGPTGSYITLEDRPNIQHLNLNTIYEQKNQQKYREQEQQLCRIVQEYVKQNKLSDIIGINSNKLAQLLWYNRQRFIKSTKFIKKKLSRNMLKQLQLDGQCWNKSTPLPTLFISIKFVIKTLLKSLQQFSSKQQQQTYNKLYLLLARLSYMHNKILRNPVKTLNVQVLTNYSLYIKNIKKSMTSNISQYIMILLQYMHALLFYYKYNQSAKILEYCKKLTNMSIQYTGKMGRRTKFQLFDTPQLIMSIQGNQVTQKKQEEYDDSKEDMEKLQDSLVDIPAARQLIAMELLKISENKEKQTVIKQSKFDEENILLETPKLVEEQEEVQKKQQPTITQLKLLIAIAQLSHTYSSTPKDQILFQYISTAITQIIKHTKIISVSYPLMFVVFLLRSDNQFDRIKNAERALEQYQILRDQYNNKSYEQKNKQNKYIDIMYSTAYVPHLEFIAHLADKYLSLGMAMTAVQLYEQVGMIQQCIDGLIARNYKDKAKQKIFKIFLKIMPEKLDYALIQKNNVNKTPRLLCMLADIYSTSNPQLSLQLHQQAWQLSNKKFVRAQRSIGWHYYYKKQYIQAANAFKLATQINYYNPNTWFTLGCCYMNIKQFQKGLGAFSQSISIDNTQGQAWGNMSSCYMHLNKYKQAFSTLTQAVKYSQRNWKLWANILSVSLKLKKFYKYFEAVSRLLQLQQYQLLTYQVFHKMVIIFQHYQQTNTKRSPILSMKRRIDQIYQSMVSKIGNNPIVHKFATEYYLEIENYIVNNYRHYLQTYKDNNFDNYDIIQDGYKAQQQQQYQKKIKTITNHKLMVIYKDIVNAKQTQLNMTMRIGWDSNKKESEQVYKILQEYMWIWNTYNSKIISSIKQGEAKNQYKDFNQAEYQLFVEGVRKKIQNCLQKQIKLKPKEL